MNACEVVIAVAATHRLTTLVVDDEITRPSRDWLDKHFPDSRLTYLVNCRACASVWTGFVIGFLPRRVRLALALSAGVLAVTKTAELVEARIDSG